MTPRTERQHRSAVQYLKAFRDGAPNSAGMGTDDWWEGFAAAVHCMEGIDTDPDSVRDLDANAILSGLYDAEAVFQWVDVLRAQVMGIAQEGG